MSDDDGIRVEIDGVDVSRFARAEFVGARPTNPIDLAPWAEFGEVSWELYRALPFTEGDLVRVVSGEIEREFRVAAIDHDDLSFVLETTDGGPAARLDVPGHVIGLIPPDGIRRELEIQGPEQ